MIKKVFIVFLVIVFVVIFATVCINMFNNNPYFIAKNLKYKIEQTKNDKFKDYSDWLWQENRAFTFDVVYMNIFSAGRARLSVKGNNYFKDVAAFNLDAIMEPSDFLKKLYNAKMTITDAVAQDTKVSLWYRELSSTPEEEETKEIIFDPKTNIAEREGIKFKIPDFTYDPLSAFFNLLDAKFNIGEPIVLNLLSKEEIYEFKATPIELKNNIYKLQGEVYRQDRSSTHGARFTLWIKNGSVRVPLLVRVVSAAGPVYLRLKNVN